LVRFVRRCELLCVEPGSPENRWAMVPDRFAPLLPPFHLPQRHFAAPQRTVPPLYHTSPQPQGIATVISDNLRVRDNAACVTVSAAVVALQ